MKNHFVLILLIGFSSCFISRSHSCTIFRGTTPNKVLVGNNEDFIDPNTYVWFLTAEKNKLGRVYFGFGSVLPQGGMNEKGLFFDCAAVPPRLGRFFNQKEVYKGSLMELALETCTNVDEVVNLFEKYDRSYMTYQILFADIKGNSVIIETDTIIFKKGKYQIAANYCHSQNAPEPYSIERYNIVDSMLEAETNYSIEYFRDILNASHQENNSPTQYSNIFDLLKGDIYIYLFHNYTKCCQLNIYDELKKGSHSYRLSDLVEESSDYKNYLHQYRNPDYKIISADSSYFQRYIGEYELDGFPPVKYIVSQEFGKMFLMLSGFNKYQLYPISEKTYFMKELNLLITFEQNENRLKDKISASLYGLIYYTAARIK